MGNCSCVNHIEDQQFYDAVSIPNKFEHQEVESELIEKIQILPDITVQALVRCYISRKRLNRKTKKEEKSPNLNEIDLRLYISEDIQNILKGCPLFEYTVTGDIFQLPENQIFIGYLKSHDELTPGYLLSPNTYYKGTIKNMQYEGQGTLINSNGNIYIGGFKKGVFHGKGDFQSATDNKRYSGSWEAGQCNGQGTVFNSDGSVCKALFAKGLKSGCGNITFRDGSNYSGSFKQDQINGIGKFSWSDGRVYEGHWKDEKMHGKGKLTYPDGRVYEGDFVDSLKEGSGIYAWPDGKKYEGSWKSGKQHGIGVLYEKDKKHKKGEWRHGKRIRWIE